MKNKILIIYILGLFYSIYADSDRILNMIRSVTNTSSEVRQANIELGIAENNWQLQEKSWLPYTTISSPEAFKYSTLNSKGYTSSEANIGVSKNTPGGGSFTTGLGSSWADITNISENQITASTEFSQPIGPWVFRKKNDPSQIVLNNKRESAKLTYNKVKLEALLTAFSIIHKIDLIDADCRFLKGAKIAALSLVENKNHLVALGKASKAELWRTEADLRIASRNLEAKLYDLDVAKKEWFLFFGTEYKRLNNEDRNDIISFLRKQLITKGSTTIDERILFLADDILDGKRLMDIQNKAPVMNMGFSFVSSTNDNSAEDKNDESINWLMTAWIGFSLRLDFPVKSSLEEKNYLLNKQLNFERRQIANKEKESALLLLNSHKDRLEELLEYQETEIIQDKKIAEDLNILYEKKEISESDYLLGIANSLEFYSQNISLIWDYIMILVELCYRQGKLDI